MSRLLIVLSFVVASCMSLCFAQTQNQTDSLCSGRVISLDGDQWLLAPDPKNIGREQRWADKPQPTAKQTRVPWIIQDVFPGYHGVAWYWRDFQAQANPHRRGRYLLRFWAVDYKADVWINGVYVGEHEGGETPFVLDITDAVKPEANNRIAVRVLNPTEKPIDGFVLGETPHRVKAGIKNIGGILESVELITSPAVRIEDLFVRPDPESGNIRIQANVHNTLDMAVKGRLVFTAAPAASGETLAICTE